MSVSVGTHHFLACDSLGHVYGWGLNDRGQIGTSESSDGLHNSSDRPCMIHLPPTFKATSVACCAKSSYVIGDNGSVYGWGDNNAGQLGQPDNVEMSSRPRLIELPDKALEISAGNAHVFCRTTHGGSYRYYAWGSNLQGQLGIRNTQSVIINSPTYVPFLNSLPVSVSYTRCGVWDTIARTTLGELWRAGEAPEEFGTSLRHSGWGEFRRVRENEDTVHCIAIGKRTEVTVASRDGEVVITATKSTTATLTPEAQEMAAGEQTVKYTKISTAEKIREKLCVLTCCGILDENTAIIGGIVEEPSIE
eukprot:GHVO01069979.1.p1 GENE.GHVO01069979.1~~GHVO01069979.1.p1  ORF type:complete len:306 (-),score=47.89 GHVO01069979.1:88-1005(-)